MFTYYDLSLEHALSKQHLYAITPV